MSASASASVSVSASASEAMEAACVVDDLADNTKAFAGLSREQLTQIAQDNLNWSIDVARETADFARAVVKYKEADYREQTAGNREENKSQDHAIIITAKEACHTARELKNEDAWKKAGVAVREALAICQNNTQGMSSREAIEAAQQKDYWEEQANLADIKALATSSYANAWKPQLERANAIMKMTHEKFGSPISQTLRAFIGQPNETTLRATGKSALIAMSAAEVEEALEGAEIFAKKSTNEAALVKRQNWYTSLQESIKSSAFVTSEVAEFFRALAAFKRVQESEEAAELAKQPEL
ncbi:MAG TPA: hypothetical protein VJK54_02525, partial [Chthoniobacterales bacterium]|nr:hypothetical protein [Chthoniobacterales bacterium]